MVSETTDSCDDRAGISKSKKNSVKVPRKVHKAAREKRKRNQMNELFLNLEKTLGNVDHHNNGKASLLRETIRLLGELVSQMDSLKRENATLLSEYNYITSEKNELLEDTSALDDQVKRLRSEIDERAQSILSEEHVAVPVTGHASEMAPVVAPVFVMPFPDIGSPKVPSEVSRPRPRYPSSADSWPSHILSK